MRDNLILVLWKKEEVKLDFKILEARTSLEMDRTFHTDSAKVTQNRVSAKNDQNSNGRGMLFFEVNPPIW